MKKGSFSFSGCLLGTLKGLFILFAAGTILGMVAGGCSSGSSGDTTQAADEATDSAAGTASGQDSGAEKSADGGSQTISQTAAYQIDEPMRTERFEFTVTDSYVLENLGEGKKVPEGAVYVVVGFEYKNISKQPISSWDLPTVQLMDKNDAVYSPDADANWYFDGYSDEKIVSDMNPGIKTKGTEIFEVARDVLDEGGMRAYIKADAELLVDLDLSDNAPSSFSATDQPDGGYGNAKADSFYSEDLGEQPENGWDPDTPYYSDAGETMDTPHILIEDSSTDYLEDSDIYWMTPEQLRYAKNEIYARHGRRFNDAGLQAWFDAQTWYSGTIAPGDFDESALSAVEKANIQVIQHRLEVNSR